MEGSSSCSRAAASAGKLDPTDSPTCVTLPPQLESLTPAVEFPTSRHKWNSNEDIAAVLIAFDKHKEWQLREPVIRPPSGSMLLFSRKKVRYRKDGYCWKKRRDGKTIREDHMKLKVQGVECIYGSYVHSAILPTFHRRCYWLLQNPDLVLVHYLNMPNVDNTKLTIPTLSCDMEKKEWTKEELVEQLRPMLAGARKGDVGNEQDRLVENTIEAIVLINVRSKNGAPISLINSQLPAALSQASAVEAQLPALLHSLPNSISITPSPHPQPPSSTPILCAPLPQTQQQPPPAPSSTPVQTSIPRLVKQEGPHPSTPCVKLELPSSPLQVTPADIQQNLLNTMDMCKFGQHLIGQVDDPKALASLTHGRRFEMGLGVDGEAGKGGEDVDRRGVKIGEGRSCREATENSGIHGVGMVSQGLGIPTSITQGETDGSRFDGGGGGGGSGLIDSVAVGMRMGDSAGVGSREGEGIGGDEEGAENCDTLDGSFPSLPSDLNLDILLDFQDLDEYSDLDVQNLGGDNRGHCSISSSIPTPAPAALSVALQPGIDSHPVIHCASCLSHQRSQQVGVALPTTTSTTPAMAPSCLPSPGDVAHLVHQPVERATSHAQGDHSFRSLTAITDFCPDWSHTEGGTKILVTGLWYSTNSSYTCLFDGCSIKASLVQPGVLRCFTPAHEAGLVSLQVACDGFIISNSETFRFVADTAKSPSAQQENEWFSVSAGYVLTGAQLKQILTERLQQLEKKLVLGNSWQPTTKQLLMGGESEAEWESNLIRYVEELAGCDWLSEDTYPKAGHSGLTLLHLAAGLGYAKFINSLIHWRADSPNLVLEYEVDAHSVDNHACTPLMWACVRGNVMAATALCRWNAGPLKICNKDGQLPLDAARLHGHHGLASQLTRLQEEQKQQALSFTRPGADTLHGFSTSTGAFPPRASCESTSSAQTDRNGGKTENLCIEIPSSQSLPAESKLLRRLSEQAISTPRPLSKRYSVDLLPGGAGQDHTSPPLVNCSRQIRESNSEPHLLMVSNQPSSSAGVGSRDLASPDMMMQTDIELPSSEHPLGHPPHIPPPAPIPQKTCDHLLVQMDTDELSMRSDSPFIDVEKISSDEEVDVKGVDSDEHHVQGTLGTHDAKTQMVTLANQIIAAMPERIKLSPAREDDADATRQRSESHSSVQSQGSPGRASSFTDDSGISTPMTDSLAFDEYRYTDLGTPASSLSPDSTCLPSPYSPYNFSLDSPPPTTADFTEYFNAPTTYMEKDFSQLTLSDQEQRKLYEAAKVIQNAYRIYKDKQQQQQQQQQQQEQQKQKEIEAAVLIQSYYRRYKQYAYFKKMTHAAVLIQNQFRSYYAQKRLKKSRDPTTPSQYRPYKEPERLKKGRNQSVIIQQRFRSHYQRKTPEEKEGGSQVGMSADTATESSPPPEESPTPNDAIPPTDADEDLHLDKEDC